MRALLATSLGVLSTATLLLPPAAVAAAHGAPQASGTALRNASPAHTPPRLPGSTQSLPLTSAVPAAPEGVGAEPRAGARTGAGTAPTDTVSPPEAEAGLQQRTVRPFSLVGVVWSDADDRLDAVLQVRTRSAEDGRWSPWRTLEAHPEHAASGGEAGGGQSEEAHRGSTAPLWVGRSDGVQVRIQARGAELPRGLRLELVDPGEGPGGAGGPQGAGVSGPSDPVSARKSPAALPELTKEQTADLAERHGFAPDLAKADGEPYVGPRPGIVIRRGWGADPDVREGGYAYGDDVRMAFVHHTAGSNSYSCKEAPKVIRGIYRYHVRSLGWRDIGYNFLIDKCGTIYEGRAGGVTEPVRGAHTLGFNNASMGVAVLGEFGRKKPPKKATDAIAKLTAWKLGLYGVNAGGTTRMTSGGGKYPKGRTVRMHTISGHRDGFATECPGEKLYDRLPAIRDLAARLQGR